MNNLETRSTRIPLAADGKKLVGYVAVWDSPADIYENGRQFVETIQQGAFSKSLIENKDIIAYFNHNPDRLLGRSSSGTVRFSEDDKGLLMELDLPEHAADVREMVERGDLTGGSFTFRVRRGGETWNGNVRTLTDLELFEAGPVGVPAYAATSLGLRTNELYRYKLLAREKTTLGNK
jgi:uncharacterized protein